MHFYPVLHRTMVILEKQDNEAFGFEVQVCFVLIINALSMHNQSFTLVNIGLMKYM